MLNDALRELLYNLHVRSGAFFINDTFRINVVLDMLTILITCTTSGEHPVVLESRSVKTRSHFYFTWSPLAYVYI
jgi:hypothetical protein